MKFELYQKILNWKEGWLGPAKKYIDSSLIDVNKKFSVLKVMKTKVDECKEKEGLSKGIKGLYQEFLDFSRLLMILKGELLVERQQIVEQLKMAKYILKLQIPIETRREIEKLDKEMKMNPENFKEISSKKDKILRPYVEEKEIDEDYVSTVEESIAKSEKELLAYSNKVRENLQEYNEIFASIKAKNQSFLDNFQENLSK